MALPDSVKLVDGTSYIIAFDSEWPAAPTNGWSAVVDAELDLGALAAGAFRQSAKLDITANRDSEYKLEMLVEMETPPTAGETLNVYAGFSDNVTAASGNPGGLSGAEGSYAGLGGGSAAASVKQLDFVGSLVLDVVEDTDTTPHQAIVGILRPTARYCMFVVENAAASAAIFATGDATALRLTGMTVQIQD